MESKIKASFIPKKPVAQSSGASTVTHRSSGVDLMMLIAIVMLVIAGVLAAGVFLYKNMTEQDYATKQAALKRAQADFQPKLIAQFKQLSNRIRVAEGILNDHIAPSVFLYSLERDTLTGVQFTDFDFKQKSAELAEFSLKGKTGSVNSVALQSSRFSESTMIKNSIFSDIDLVKGGVTFKVTGEIDLDTIRFANVLSGIQQPAAASLGELQSLHFDQITSTTTGTTTNNINNPQDDFGTFGNFE